MKTPLIIFCLFVAFTTNANAQTKEETTKWLTEKMLKPGFFQDVWWSTEITKISKIQFDDNFLIITGSSIYDEKKYDKIIYTYKTTFSFKIDLTKLTDDVYKGSWIATKGNAIKVYKVMDRYGMKYGEWTFLDEDVTDKYDEGMYPMGINMNIEPDIQERFKKAIKHYQSLMTIKKSTETF